MDYMRTQKNLGPHGLPDVLISSQDLHHRIEELGRQITNDYRGRQLTVLGILKGSFLFMADLVRMLDIPVMTEFMGISSYGTQTHSSGEVRITSDVKHPIDGLDVLIVEDIVDTGLTMEYLVKYLQVRNPRTLKICSLLHKPAKQLKPVTIDYLGFSIPDHFVVGYGLDFQGLYRNLNYIGHFTTPPV